VLLGVSLYLERIYKKNPETLEARVRRWLFSLVVFIAALIVFSDVVGIVILTFFEKLSTAAILYAVAPLIVSGMIFGYYLCEMREENRPYRKYFVYIAIPFFVAIIIISFLVPKF